MEITSKLLPAKTKRRPGIAIKGVKFIVLHDTGNDGSTAKGNVNYYITSANEIEAAAHFFVDDKEIINCIPESEIAYHVRRTSDVDNKMFGCDAIDYALAIELCYSTKGLFDSKKAYQNYCELIASLCIKYNLDPNIHLVAHSTLDPKRRTDPMNALSKIGKSWADMINDVYVHMPTLKPKSEKTKAVFVPESKYELVMRYLASIGIS